MSVYLEFRSVACLNIMLCKIEKSNALCDDALLWCKRHVVELGKNTPTNTKGTVCHWNLSVCFLSVVMGVRRKGLPIISHLIKSSCLLVTNYIFMTWPVDVRMEDFIHFDVGVEYCTLY